MRRVVIVTLAVATLAGCQSFGTSGNSGDGQWALLLVLAPPLAFAFIVERWPVNGMMIGGLIGIYAGGALLGLPLLGPVAAAILLGAGAILVGIAGALAAVLRALSRIEPPQAAKVAEEIDARLRERARQRQRTATPPTR